MATAAEMATAAGTAIPVSVLTGFLGSGKTTLLAAALRHPAFARTAVIINEFGEIGLDHDLIETSDESFVTLQTGCLCCKVRGDLAATIADMLARRAAGTVPPFTRIVIETSGLADPAPILHALMTDDGLAGRVTLAGVVATVDAVNGPDTLAREAISVKQVAVADRLIVTKLDLARVGATPDTRGGGALFEPQDCRHPDLAARLAALNPAVTPLVAAVGRIDPEALFACGHYDASARIEDVQAWLAAEAHLARHAPPDAHLPGHRHEHTHTPAPDRHDTAIATYVLYRDKPIRAVALTLFLEALAEHCGADLLRLKGILAIAESPERPAVIHGVQHVFHPLAWLPRWPSADRSSRLVFITRNIPRAWIEALLAAIEDEVEATVPVQAGNDTMRSRT